MLKRYPFLTRFRRGPKPLNEDAWFRLFQPLLLKMANTDYGRDLLCIEKKFPEIIAISKNHITARLAEGQYVSQFRLGSKYGNVIRHRWGAFRQYAKYFYEQEVYGRKILMPVLNWQGQLIAAHATDTFYPDADPETSTVDGITRRSSSSENWATLRGATGTAVNDTGNPIDVAQLFSGPASNEWREMNRGVFLFDTSSITAANNVDSATFSLFGTAKEDNFSQSISLVSSSPTSNTGLVSGDHEIAKWGSTKFATDITIASYSTSAYNDFVLNASGIANISKAGVSKFGVRLSGDVDDSEPTWAASTNVKATANNADASGETNDPKLEVIWSDPLFARKIADKSLTSNDSVEDDDHLIVTLEANKEYIIDGVIFAASTSNTPDIKIAFTIPTGATMDMGFIGASSAFGHAELLESSGTESDTIPIVQNVPTVINVHGAVKVGSTAGDLTLQWAQAQSNGTATTVKEGSYLRAVAT